MEFHAKGIKWKLKICSFIWCQNVTKNFIATTKEMVTKNASLHIYVLRSIYNIVSVCKWPNLEWLSYKFWLQRYHILEENIFFSPISGTSEIWLPQCYDVIWIHSDVIHCICNYQTTIHVFHTICILSTYLSFHHKHISVHYEILIAFQILRLWHSTSEVFPDRCQRTEWQPLSRPSNGP